MTWIKLSDGLPESDVFDREKVGPLGGWLHVAALGYCNRSLNDGRFSRSRARRLIDVDDSDALIDALIEHGMWRAVEGGELEIVDYLTDQPSAAQVEATRAQWRERQERARARRESRRDNGRDTHRESLSPGPVPDRTGTTGGLSPAPVDPQPATYTISVDPGAQTAASTGYIIDASSADLAQRFAKWAAVTLKHAGSIEVADTEVCVSVTASSGMTSYDWYLSAKEWMSSAGARERVVK